jgi:alpha-beta hydrolase superfamily lysophospholipase
MTSNAPATSPAVDSPAPPRGAPVIRTPFYLPSAQGPLFAWLHTHESEPSLDHAVVLCPPIGFEQMHSHRSLRHLADALAERQIPVLRFDWHGTGDSVADDEAPDRVTAWNANVREAVEWAHRVLGCRRASIVGLRTGALLAAHGLTDTEIENFVLWAPVADGRHYVREMTLIDRSGNVRPGEAADGIEAGGFLLTPATSADFARLKLSRSHPRCNRALVVDRDDLPSDGTLPELLSGMNIIVDRVTAPGYAGMMAEPHRGTVPAVAIAEIVEWLAERIALEASSQATIDTANLGPDSVTMPVRVAADAPTVEIREIAWRFSGEPNLFGIVSEPVAEVDPAQPTIVMLNAGSSYRVGPGRLNLYLARQLSARGYRCLRLDLAGLGDSVIADASKENDCYPSTAFRDIQLAMDALVERFGMRRCVLMGLCSGAYDAFQSAAQFTTPVLVESVLINPLTFYWNDSMVVDDVMSQKQLADNYSMSAITQWKKWVKFVTGQSRLTPVEAFRLLVKLVKQSVKPQKSQASPGGYLTFGEKPSHPKVEDLSADLARVVERGRTLAMFVSKTDPGYVILKLHARRAAAKLIESGQLRVAFIDNADHTFSRMAARRALLEAIVGEFETRLESRRSTECRSSNDECRKKPE